jgi:hypothetical protein
VASGSSRKTYDASAVIDTDLEIGPALASFSRV